jgi:two-component system, chemotaxis family, protein-glutamate methylesterase/glutaminase
MPTRFGSCSSRHGRQMAEATAPAAPPMRNAPTHLVALAASAGGIGALRSVLGGLPVDYPAAVLVLLHVVPDHPSLLSQILARATALPVKQAEDGEVLAVGAVYVAPPNAHLVVDPDLHVTLAATPPVHYVRPSADVLFASLAKATGCHAIAVVLSGTGRDGALGVRALAAAGGHVIVQDEASSAFFGMPAAAIDTGAVDQVLPLAEIPKALLAAVALPDPA